jgi:hypothetical protein
MEQKHKVAALAAAWQSWRARRIEADMPASLPEVSHDNDPTTVSRPICGPILRKLRSPAKDMSAYRRHFAR